MVFLGWLRAGAAARLVLICLVAVLMTGAGATAADARRVALVVGNADYRAIPSLPNAGNDTRDVAEALRRLDFEVTLLSDVSTEMFWVVLDAFGRQAQGADAVLFYYAGHAFQIGGVNHLVPVSARLADPARITDETWSMTDVLGRLQGSGATVLMFLDACRTSPVPGVTADGLAPMDGGKGSFIAFATRPGAVSWDAAGTGGHSPFAASLLRHIEEPGLGISDLMIRVRNDVDAATDGRQVPWDQSSLRAQFFFRPAGAALPATVEVTAPAAAPEEFVFEVVEETTIVGPAPVAPDGPAPVEVAAVAPPAPPPAPTPVPAPAPVAVLPAPERPPLPPVQRIGGAQGERLAALADGTRGAAVVAPVVPQPTGPVATAERPVLAALPSPDDPAPPEGAAPPAAGAVAALPPAPAAEDLPRAVQEELKRLGCYRLTVDGDWGNGSRNALRRYYEVKKVAAPEELEPTEALWRSLGAEKDGLCPAPPPAPKAASAPKPQGAAPKAAPKAAAQEPAKKKEPTCRFMVVAIVCS